MDDEVHVSKASCLSDRAEIPRASVSRSSTGAEEEAGDRDTLQGPKLAEVVLDLKGKVPDVVPKELGCGRILDLPKTTKVRRQSALGRNERPLARVKRFSKRFSPRGHRRCGETHV